MLDKIIDTHVHCWSFARAKYSWLKEDNVRLYRDFLPEEYDKERIAAGITEAILVQAANSFEDTDYMLDVAARNDWVAGVVGWVPLLDPTQAAVALQETYASHPFFKGVRHLIHDEPDPKWLLQEPVIESLRLLADADIPFDVVGVLPQHLEVAIQVGEKVPHLKMVLNHLNQPPINSGEKFGTWGELMKAAAQNPNFFIKISGLGNTSQKEDKWTADDIKPYVAFALEHFGTDRAFLGGNWPVALLAGSFQHTWQAYAKVIEALVGTAEQENIYYRNAEQFYKL